LLSIHEFVQIIKRDQNPPSLDQHFQPCLAVTGWTTRMQLSVAEDPTFRTREDGARWKKVSLALDRAMDQPMIERLCSETWTVLIIFLINKWTDEAAIGLLLDSVPQQGPNCFTRLGVFQAGWSKRAFDMSKEVADRVQLGSRTFERQTIYLY